ncbi:hypothetical protein ABZW03_17550 [Kitasatospora sp. NPDC004799]|uniref:hypothetical protein n=1 Tax=Kitasatospora sp. NPDC004799 TaxID=3154460 RepID=UPI0033B71CB9
MGLPLAAGHVLVRLQLGEGPQHAAEAVLDALEAAFPTHTGRGRTMLGNVWEDPATVTSEGVRVVAEPRISRTPAAPAPSPSASLSQSFDARSSDPRSSDDHRTAAPVPPAVPPGGLVGLLLGAPQDVERVLRALAGLCRVHEEGREQQGPQLAVRLRLDRPG